MNHQTLLVGGKNLDTGKYRYYPYAEKFITLPRDTLSALHNLEKGHFDSNLQEFIFARCSIGDEDVNRLAIESAYRASKKFRAFSVSRRKKICQDISRLLKTRKQELVDLLICEGHPPKLAAWEIRGMEIGGSSRNVSYYASLLNQELPRSRKEEARLTRRPDGVVCVCPPSNAAASNSFLAILALLAGNAVIVKPPITNPISTIFLWKEIVNEALTHNGAPDGTVNVIVGNSRIIMDQWLADTRINDILFFGDSKVGLDIGSRIYAAGKKPILELSGNDMLVAWKDADLHSAVRSATDAFLGSTQICMVPKMILIHEAIYEDFADAMISRVAKIKAGLPSDENTILTPVTRIHDFFHCLNDALHHGAKVLCGGKRINYRGEVDDSGTYIQPTLLRVDDDLRVPDMNFFNKEIFFPLLPLVKVSGSDAGIFERICELAEMNPYGLRISVWTKSEQRTKKFSESLGMSGLLRINLRHTDFSYYLSTHGGMKQSGGPYGSMNLIWEKTSHLQGISRAIS